MKQDSLINNLCWTIVD